MTLYRNNELREAVQYQPSLVYPGVEHMTESQCRMRGWPLGSAMIRMPAGNLRRLDPGDWILRTVKPDGCRGATHVMSDRAFRKHYEPASEVVSG